MQTPTNVTGCIDPAGRAFVTQFSAKYLAALDEDAAPWPWADIVSLDTAEEPITEHVVNLQTYSGMRKWEGEREYKEWDYTTFKVEDEKFERSIRIAVDDFVSKKFGKYSQIPAELAMAVKALPKHLLEYCLINGDSASLVKAYDGLALFATNHKVNPKGASGSATFSNLFTGGSALPFNDTSLKAVRKIFREMKGPNGQPMGLRLTHVLVGPEHEDELDRLFNARELRTDPGSSGGLQQSIGNWQSRGVKGIVVDGLGADTDGIWYPVAAMPGRPGRPFHLHMPGGEGAPLKVIGEDSEHCKKNDEVLFMVDKKAVAFPCFPQMILRCEAS